MLNLQPGGITPAAVDFGLHMGTAVIWMPPFHSLANLQQAGCFDAYALNNG
jgi:hypothetical protein